MLRPRRFCHVKSSLLARPVAAGHDKASGGRLGQFLEVSHRNLSLARFGAVGPATNFHRASRSSSHPGPQLAFRRESHCSATDATGWVVAVGAAALMVEAATWWKAGAGGHRRRGRAPTNPLRILQGLNSTLIEPAATPPHSAWASERHRGTTRQSSQIVRKRKADYESTLAPPAGHKARCEPSGRCRGGRGRVRRARSTSSSQPALPTDVDGCALYRGI
jgi:hypothetical protein